MDEFNGVLLWLSRKQTHSAYGIVRYLAKAADRISCFVFQTDNLDITIECLMKKSGNGDRSIRLGTYRSSSAGSDENEIVIFETL